MKKATMKRPPPCLVGLITKAAVCELLGCSEASLYRKEADGAHPFPRRKRFGGRVYFSERAVRQWIAEALGDIAA